MDPRGYKGRAKRIGVSIGATLMEPDGCRVSVTILDVSSTGFRLQSPAELTPGDDVQLRVRRRAPIRARIHWTRGLEAGGTFLDPVAL